MGGVWPNSLAFVKGLWGATCNGVQLPESGTPFVAKIATASIYLYSTALGRKTIMLSFFNLSKLDIQLLSYILTYSQKIDTSMLKKAEKYL